MDLIVACAVGYMSVLENALLAPVPLPVNCSAGEFSDVTPELVASASGIGSTVATGNMCGAGLSYAPGTDFYGIDCFAHRIRCVSAAAVAPITPMIVGWWNACVILVACVVGVSASRVVSCRVVCEAAFGWKMHSI